MGPSKFLAISAADASVNQVSAAIVLDQMLYASIVVLMTGASTGTLKVQVSNDLMPQPASSPVPTNWVDLAGISVVMTANSTFIIPKFDVCYGYMRLVYTKNNGSAGTISAFVKTISF